MTEMRSISTIGAMDLRDWTARVLETHSLPDNDAAAVADALVDTSLRGVDTHGVILLPRYLDLLKSGVTNASPQMRTEFGGAIFKVDGDRGMGQVIVARAMDQALAKARANGSVIISIKRVGHLGALGYFARRAADAGLVSLILQNGPPLMGLPGSISRGIGNNPIAFGAPVAGNVPIVFDAAASEVSHGKLREASENGQPIPMGWALDMKGKPTTDANEAVHGILLPSGGPKGIGLAMLVEVLAGSFSGTRPVSKGDLFGAFVLLVDPAAGDPSFTQDMVVWLSRYRSSSQTARYPGQDSFNIHRQRLAAGIPMSHRLREQLSAIGKKADIAFPA